MNTSLHLQLWSVCKKLPDDYQPYGSTERAHYPDCSSGCLHFVVLEGPAGSDWGICKNAASHRAGLLTFEHQGCLMFAPDPLHDIHEPLES
jgi:hypothetical protein